MATYLVSWIGMTDLRASRGELEADELGPIGQAINHNKYDKILLIANQPRADIERYIDWLSCLTSAEITFNIAKLSTPTDFGDIYTAVVNVLSPLVLQKSPVKFTFHLSPGTPAMAAVWIILAKTRFPAELIESSREVGVKTVSVPFDISAEFIPELFRQSDEELKRLTTGLPPEAPEFEEIIHKSQVMQAVVARARRVAPRNIPVLLEGESGTGKELFARAIHNSSPRKNDPFITVNCGAIPNDLVESILFGHKKGAFTGAIKDHVGYFESANRGTLFLDEINELPLNVQVKLLRILQEGEVVPIGEVEPRKINVRIIAATNRSLINEIQNGNFREDLYYRIAVAVIKLPPLRERGGDVGLLVDRLLEMINKESETEPGFIHKNISTKARNLILKHAWPGNVRQLLNTLRGAAIWSDHEKITEEDISYVLSEMPNGMNNTESIMNKNISEAIDLKEIISDVARHYLTAALKETNNNKTHAARLLGLGNYQTLSNWIDKYGLND